MAITVKTKIGNQEITLQFDKMSEVHKWNSTYGNLPKVCDACKSPNIFLSFKSPGGNDYFMLACGDCGATGNFGIHKDGKGLFWKRETKMEVYRGGVQGDSQAASNDPEHDSDLPF